MAIRILIGLTAKYHETSGLSRPLTYDFNVFVFIEQQILHLEITNSDNINVLATIRAGLIIVLIIAVTC